MLQVNDKAPNFVLDDETGTRFSLADHDGESLLLVFYPGDDTPVCTRQLCDYRDGIERFDGLGVRVVGISRDGADSHRAFKEKHGLPFTLLSDPGLSVAQAYDARGIMGMKRAVYLLDGHGTIRYRHIEALPIFRRAREEIIAAIEEIQSSQNS